VGEKVIKMVVNGKLKGLQVRNGNTGNG